MLMSKHTGCALDNKDDKKKIMDIMMLIQLMPLKFPGLVYVSIILTKPAELINQENTIVFLTAYQKYYGLKLIYQCRKYLLSLL